MSEEQKRYTAIEFAKMIGVTVQTLGNWRRQERLVPNYTIGGRPYYTDEHLEYVKNYK